MSPHPPEEERHLENLRAVAESLRRPAAPRPGVGSDAHPSHRGRNTALGGLVAGAAFLLGKLKLVGLLAGVLEFKTLATMLLSIGVYGMAWGLPFATGFVLLIFVHELGHALVMRREGIPAGAPVFIPFVGAIISMRGRPRDAAVEARVGLGGPVLGSLAAWVVMAVGLAAGKPMLVGLGHVGALAQPLQPRPGLAARRRPHRRRVLAHVLDRGLRARTGGAGASCPRRSCCW